MKKKKLMTILLTMMLVSIVSVVSYAAGWTEEEDGEWYYIDSDGVKETEKIKTSDGYKYYLDDEGKMVRDYLLEDYNESIYYFDDEGKMVMNTWVAVDPMQTQAPIDNGPTVYLYYFGPSGKAYKATNGIIKKTIDGKKYLFDNDGRMLTGWINESGDMFNSQDISDDPFVDEYIYYAGDETDGVLREGWYEFIEGSVSDDYYKKDSLWFYFSPSSNKKTRYDGTNAVGSGAKRYTTKKINGHTYAFDENGVMLTGWEVEPATQYYAEDKIIEGQLMKKSWVFAVPSEEISKKDHEDDIEQWFYASKSGDITKSIIKKINGKDYSFDDNGIMKTGLVIFTRQDKKFVANIDIDSTDAKLFLTEGKYMDKDTETEGHFDKKTQVLYYFNDNPWEENFGARKIGDMKLAFSDKDYFFSSEKIGEKEGLKSKERTYYQHGLRLIPDPLVGYGLVLEGYASPSTIDQTDPNQSIVQRAMEENRAANIVGDPDIFTNTTIDPTEMSKIKELYNNRYHSNEYYIASNYEYYGDNNAPHWSPCLKVVNSSGKRIKGNNKVVKDKNNNYWIIGKDSRFIKVVSVPVKYSSREWQFRSEFSEGEDKGNKTRYGAFGVADAYGRTVRFTKQDQEKSYDVRLDDTYALNFGWLEE